MNWTRVPASTLIDTGAVAALVDHLDDPGFDRVLLDFLEQAGVAVAEVSGISSPHGGTPRAVGWCGRRADAGRRAEALATRFHRHDPLLRTLPQDASIGTSLVGVVQPRKIADDGHRWLCFDEPGYRLRVTVARAEASGWALFNLYLSENVMSEAQMLHLAGLAAVSFPFIRRHRGWCGDGADAPPAPDPASRLADLLGTRYPTLTQRERHVCAMTVMGKDSGTIANHLAITRNTVLTYRRRAYERLGVSSASALLANLV